MTKEQLLESAINAVKLDGISVIPVAKTKIPLIKWTEFQNRFATEEEIRGWFEKFKDCQIGWVTGPISNMTVVDVEAGGDWSWLPQETFIVKTGGGGRHYIYRFQEGMQNKARIKPLTDIRSTGGYIMSLGSCSEKGSYELIKKAPPAPFPIHLFEEKAPVSPGITQATISREVTPEEVRSDMFFLLESFPGYGPGQRNDETTSFIGKVFSRINPLHWGSHGWETIVKANLKNKPPLPQNELLASFKSILGARTREMPVLSSTGLVRTQAVPLGDASDEVKHISVVAAEQAINQEEVYPLEMPIFDEALEGGVCLGDIVIIAAPTGNGKTSLAQDWTLSFIRGKQKAPVLWFTYEVMTRNLWKKFKIMGMTEDDLAVVPAKNTTGNVAWVEAKIKEAKEKFKVKAVVIDHLGFLLPKTNGVMGQKMSMNQSSFITQIVRDLKTIAINEEVIIILPVHMNKGKEVTQDQISNSSGIAQEADAVFLLAREKNNDSAIKEYFTEYTKITLSKNRKTGASPFGWFTMINQRFVFSDRNNHEKLMADDYDNFSRIAEEEKKKNG